MTPAFPTLVAEVFLDGRDDRLSALLLALAPRAGVTRIVLIHVVEAGRAWVGRAPPSSPRPPLLDARVADLGAALPNVEVEGLHRSGRSIDEIARVAAERGADLLVVERSGGAEGWAEHGQRLLRLADCSVLVAPEGAAPRFGRAAVGMDFSESARAAMALAERLADQVRVVAVVDPVDERVDAAVLDASRAAWRELVGADEQPELVVVAGRSPAEALLSLPDVDLLVCGSRGLTPLAAVLLGSTAEKLGAACTGLLLVSRTRGEHQGLFQTLFRG